MADPERGIYYLRLNPNIDEAAVAQKREKQRRAAFASGIERPNTAALSILVRKGLKDAKDQKEYGEAGRSDWMSSDYILQVFGKTIRKRWATNITYHVNTYNNLSKYLLLGVEEGWLQLGEQDQSSGQIKAITK